MKIIKFARVCLCLILLSSCNDIKLQLDINKFMRNVVQMPDKMLKMYDGKASLSKVFEEGALCYIIYADPEECKSCLLNHPEPIERIYGLVNQREDFDVLVIMDPDEEDLAVLKDDILGKRLSFPVYIDKDHQFRAYNNFIPDDSRFHCFLLNKDHSPIFVGSPVVSEAAWKMFRKKLNSIHQD